MENKDYLDAIDLMKRREFVSAVSVLRDLIAHDNAPQYLCSLAAALVEVGQEQEALVHARQAAQKEPNSFYTRYILAMVCTANKLFEEAEHEFRVVAVLHHKEQEGVASVPAHQALHNLDQLDYIDTQRAADVKQILTLSDKRINELRHELTYAIKGSSDGIPAIAADGDNGAMLTHPPLVFYQAKKVASVLNTQTDFKPCDVALASGAEKVMTVDALLSPEGLQEIQNLCLQSTIWQRPYKSGYIGAFPEFGFANQTLFQLAEEIKKALPQTLANHRLAQWWSFVCDSNLDALNIHSDEADISVNFWITPDSANLTPDEGGLVIWDVLPPPNWEFDDYNVVGKHVTDFLAKSGVEPMAIPYRENRAVIFNGHLFHRSGKLAFKQGFENRRRNITLLFKKIG